MSDILLVTGSRDGLGARSAGQLREAINRASVVVVGDAKGVDAFARSICEETGTSCHVFEADWPTHGKAAGPMRNRDMVTHCRVLHGRAPLGHKVLCVAFPAPDSRGTWDCIRQAVDARIPVLVRSAW